MLSMRFVVFGLLASASGLVINADPPPRLRQGLPGQPRKFTMLENGLPHGIKEAKYWIRRRGALYAASGADFKKRGAGWLFANTGLILAADLDPQNEQIRIAPLDAGASCNASRISIWVRVRGAEMHAGKAEPSLLHCEWTFALGPMAKPGTYTVEAKLLHYDGALDHDIELCNVQNNVQFEGVVIRHFNGSKVYNLKQGCCEMCTIEQGCTHWTSPGIDNYSKCTLFSSITESGARRGDPRNARSRGQSQSEELASSVFLLPSERKMLGPASSMSGTRRQEATSHFIGCGWSNILADSQCLDVTDDTVANYGFTFQFDTMEVRTAERPCNSVSDIQSPGYWVATPEHALASCTKNITYNSPDMDISRRYPVLHYDDGDGVCWYREVQYDIRNHLSEWGSAAQYRPSFQEVSELSAPGKQISFTWQPTACSLQHVENSEIQKCIDRKKIREFKLQGDSIMGMFQPYVDSRLASMKYYTGEDGMNVTIANLELVHKIWGHSRSEWGDIIADQVQKITERSPQDLTLWVNAPFISSEREEFCRNDRAVQYADEFRDAVKDLHNVHELNYHDLSAAFTYESSAQADGLHTVGLPMKGLFNMAVAIMCTN